VRSGEPREWTIGELAKAAGVTVRALRHYERLGLLTPSNRSTGRHRRYGVDDVRRLYRILSFRALGFPLSSISELLDGDDAVAVREMAEHQLQHVTDQLALYRDLEHRLTRLIEALEQAEGPSPEELIQLMEVITMTVHLSRIYTKAGDKGETHLGDRSRVRKTDPRIEAYGDVDELSSHIGVAVATGDLSEREVRWLRRIQNDLYDVGADLAVPTSDRQGKQRLRIGPEYVEWLEEACDDANADLEPLRSFVLPGGSPGAAQIHVCRTVCRRAERHTLRVEDANPEIVRYLNRLSDLLFILARAANAGDDPLWDPGSHAAATA
jgi:cob(I)alamin adenosyltransferase